jgi:GT2 family glycosyltransferase
MENKIPEDFDAEFYLNLHNDVKDAGLSAEQHYLDFGVNEGRKYKSSENSLKRNLYSFMTLIAACYWHAVGKRVRARNRFHLVFGAARVGGMTWPNLFANSTWPLTLAGTSPNAQIIAAQSLHYQFCSVGDDPYFEQRSGFPRPGWQMLEVAMESEQPNSLFKVYIDTGNGFRESDSLRLYIKMGMVCKRLIYIPFGVKCLRFHPMEGEGQFSITHFRLVWLLPTFAHLRLAKRISNLHFKWIGRSRDEVLRGLKVQAKKDGVHWRDLALATYEATFQHNSARTNYEAWLVDHDSNLADINCLDWNSLALKPRFSIVLPVYNPNAEDLRECIDSVLSQSYPYWQLCIADDASTNTDSLNILGEFRDKDSRIDVFYRDLNGHICAASNSALTLVTGEYVIFLDQDDVLGTDALVHLARAINDNADVGLIYSDEDKLDADGNRFDPHFKPDWNPDLLLAQNYISHLCAIRTDYVRKVGGFRAGYEGSQDHDLVLRVTALLSFDQIVHIPHVLYHWRAREGSTALNSNQKDYTMAAGLDAVRSHMHHVDPMAKVEKGRCPNTYRVIWPVIDPAPLVSLLIPTRDHIEVLQPCVDKILEITDYDNFELVILDNDSQCPQTLNYFCDVQERDARVRVLRWDFPFNYSAINNFGARHAKGQIIGLINNDIEPINNGWLTEMVSQVCRKDIGCVGAKLYYPNDTIQHAGVVLGIGGVAGHVHKFFNRADPGYFQRLFLVHNLSAVTGACLLIRKAVFEQVGGLNEENLSVAFNDVDLCLKVREAGYRNLWTPYAELYHHESVSRGADDNDEKRARATRESEYMRKTWGPLLNCDPAYNPNLTLVYEDFSLK